MSGGLSGGSPDVHPPIGAQAAAPAELQEYPHHTDTCYLFLNSLLGKSTPRSCLGIIVLNEARLQNIPLIYGASPFPLVVIDVTKCFMASVISIPSRLNLQFISCCRSAKNFLLISSNSRARF